MQPSRGDTAVRATEERFLDAAERLLMEVGYARISSRSLATEAKANQGLVHYYFGSMEELFVQVLERFTARLIERQKRMYASDLPYIEKWRTAMRYLDEDRPYQKIWWELQAMAWNHSGYRDRIQRVHAAWADAMRAPVEEALARYALDGEPFGTDEWVSLIVALNEGIILERLSGITRGHAELLGAIDRWLGAHEARALGTDPGVP